MFMFYGIVQHSPSTVSTNWPLYVNWFKLVSSSLALTV